MGTEALEPVREFTELMTDGDPSVPSEPLATDVIRQVVELVGGETGSLVIRTKERGMPHWVIKQTFGLPYDGSKKFPVGVPGNNSLVAGSPAPIVMADMDRYQHFNPLEREVVNDWGIGSALGAALPGPNGTPVGILYVNWSDKKRPNADGRSLLALAANLIGRFIAPAIEAELKAKQLAIETHDEVAVAFLRRFATSAYHGDNLFELCRELESVLGTPLAVLTDQHEPMYPPTVEHLPLEHLAAECAHVGRATTPYYASSAEGGGNRLIVPIMAGTQVSGYLIAWNHEGLPIYPALKEAASIIAGQSSIAWRRACLSPLSIQGLFNGALRGTHRPAIFAEQSLFREDFRGPYRMLLVNSPSHQIEGVLPKVKAAFAPLERSSVRTTLENNIVYVASERVLRPSVMQHIQESMAELDEREGPLVLLATPSFSNLDAVKNVYENALKLATFADSIGKRQVLTPEELGVEELLLRVDDNEWSSDFVRRQIGPILQHDQMHGGELTKSLKCYLDNNCAITAAAEELYVHPNTLRYRLTKVRELMSNELATADERLAVHLALKLSRLAAA